MNSLKFIAISCMLLSALSCSKAQDSDLVVTPTGTTSYLINASAQSCTNIVAVSKNPQTTVTQDITGYYFNYQGATLAWKNLTDTAYVVSIDFEFASGAFAYNCSISGDELLALFYNFTDGTSWDGSLAPASNATTPTLRQTASLCRIRCGGAAVPDPKKTFTASGTMTVKGFQKSPNGDETPFKAKTQLRLLYQ
ncbi:MAG: hypothetical protein JSU04_12865 [Bdellovibrionales bacterium]|nr:hypothetical protein [Bdellovibrionales bacterium]